MKNYLLFAGATYYAAGGVHDLRDSFELLEDAKAEGIAAVDGEDANDDWWHVYSIEDGRIVAGSECQALGAGALCLKCFRAGGEDDCPDCESESLNA